MTSYIEQANNQYKATLTDLATKHGGYTNIPSEELRQASETLRLHCIIDKYQGKVNASILSQYMIPQTVVSLVNPDFEGIEPKVKRSQKYDAVYKWLDSNPGNQITTQQFCDVTEMSYPTTLKFIDNNPQYFRKIKRGYYEVRNPQAEREAEK
jgi:hypothetical protein